MKTVRNLVGERFGRLTLISCIGAVGKDIMWLCKCDCGKEKEASQKNLRRHHVKSCGCLGREFNSIVSVDGEVTGIIINSKKYGKRVVLIDAQDYDLVKNHKWRLLHQPNSNTEYAITNIKNNNGAKDTMRMHVLIMGKQNGHDIDHKYGNGLDNRRDNLRYGTKCDNIHNTKINKNNTTGYKGVYYVKRSKKYWAYLTANGKRHSAGMHETAEYAAKKYNELAKKHHGEFAKLNIIR